MANGTLEGNPIHTVGELPKVGSPGWPMAGLLSRVMVVVDANDEAVCAQQRMHAIK